VVGIDFPEGCTFGLMNLLTAHLFHALAGSQSMGLLEINVSKGRTIGAILADEFPPLDQDGGRADKLVSFKTIAYVQACIELAVTFQVPSLSMFYSTLIPDIYHLLGSKGGDVCARLDVSSISRA
jgi:hypothetical protein